MSALTDERTAAAVERLAAATEELVRIQRLSLKLRCYQAATTPEALEAARDSKDDRPAPPETDLPVPMRLLQQDPIDLLRAELAYAEAEKEYGHGKVPAELDLDNYAAERGLEVPEGPQVEEIWGPVPPPDGMGDGGDEVER